MWLFLEQRTATAVHTPTVVVLFDSIISRHYYDEGSTVMASNVESLYYYDSQLVVEAVAPGPWPSKDEREWAIKFVSGRDRSRTYIYSIYAWRRWLLNWRRLDSANRVLYIFLQFALFFSLLLLLCDVILLSNNYIILIAYFSCLHLLFGIFSSQKDDRERKNLAH
jgi:hypothetical protein